MGGVGRGVLYHLYLPIHLCFHVHEKKNKTATLFPCLPNAFFLHYPRANSVKLAYFPPLLFCQDSGVLPFLC